MCRRCGRFVCCSTFASGCSGDFSDGLSRRSWCPRSSIPNSSGHDSSSCVVSRPGSPHSSVPPFGGFTRSSVNVSVLGAGITVPRRDGDGHSSAVSAGLGCPSLAGPGLGTSSLNGDGGSPPVVDYIDASGETLRGFGSTGGDPSACENIPGNSRLNGDGCSGA